MNSSLVAFKSSYVQPAGRVPIADIQAMYHQLARNLVDRLVLKGVVASARDAVVRCAWPNADFGLAQRTYITGALVLNTQAVYVNAALANNKALGIYGVYNEEASPVVTNVLFQVGTGASTRLAVHVEPLFEQLENAGILSEPVVWEPNETIYIQVFPRAAKAGGERIGFYALVAEPRGPVVS